MEAVRVMSPCIPSSVSFSLDTSSDTSGAVLSTDTVTSSWSSPLVADTVCSPSSVAVVSQA